MIIRQEDILFDHGAYSCIAYGESFIGHEVFLADLYGSLRYSDDVLVENGTKYVIILLLQ